MARPCPVCGAPNGSCGDQPLVYPALTLLKEDTVADRKYYLPAQRTRRGVAGYVGKNVVIIGSAADDREAPNEEIVSTGKRAATGPEGKAAPKAGGRSKPKAGA